MVLYRKIFVPFTLSVNVKVNYLAIFPVVNESDPFADPVVAQRVGSGIALRFHNHGTRRG